MERLWVTGYRAYELGIFKANDPKIEVIKYAIKREISQQIENGIKWIITGPQSGIEQWTIDVVNTLKEDYNIQIAMLAPYLNIEKNWRAERQNQFIQMQTMVDYYASVSAHEYQSPSQLKAYQKFMLTHTEGALLIYDPEFEGKSAYDYDVITAWQQKNNYVLQTVSFDDLQEYGFEYAQIQKNDNY